MTPLREAFVLPALFLTVTLAGGLRVGDGIRLLPPSLTAIVIAVVLVSALVRSQVLVPALFMDQDRRPSENLSGAVVLLTLAAASAQTINLLMPERGLLHAAFAVFLFVQLMSLSAAGVGRIGMLRSLFVLLGASLILRFIVLESLYDPDGGTLKRVLTALMSGVTFGGIEYVPHAPITGYVAFATLALYVTGLVLLPSRPSSTSTALAVPVQDDMIRPIVVLLLIAGSAAGCGMAGRNSGGDEDPGGAAARRDALLASARVWRPPAVPPSQADLGINPPGAGHVDALAEVDCRIAVERVGGLTPKFNCHLPDSTVVKVKYGFANAELHAEVAATRLLTTLGFAADRMYAVRGVRCAGCPRLPFQSLRCLAASGLQWPCFPFGVDYERVRTFEPAVIERRLPGRRIEVFPGQGWAWYELDRIDPAKGGSPRAEVDALRLLAIFLAHWDNKAENQRLFCPEGADLPNGGCTGPVAMMQDLGATFGPTKLELLNWRRTPVWADSAACRVSMEELPWGGGTFPEQQISEEGRMFLLGLLEQLSPIQIATLFTSSGVVTYNGVSAEARSASAWTAAFLDKVRQIREAGPCPSAAR